MNKLLLEVLTEIQSRDTNETIYCPNCVPRKVRMIVELSTSKLLCGCCGTVKSEYPVLNFSKRKLKDILFKLRETNFKERTPE